MVCRDLKGHFSFSSSSRGCLSSTSLPPAVVFVTSSANTTIREEERKEGRKEGKKERKKRLEGRKERLERRGDREGEMFVDFKSIWNV